MLGSVSVTLQDNMGIIIPSNRVLQHIKAYWRNDSFYLHMTYTGDPDSKEVDAITPVVFEDYMKQINQQDLLVECKSKDAVDPVRRQKIIQIAVDFLILNYGIDVNIFKRSVLSNALVKLFPFLGIKDGNDVGTVSICHTIDKTLLPY